MEHMHDTIDDMIVDLEDEKRNAATIEGIVNCARAIRHLQMVAEAIGEALDAENEAAFERVRLALGGERVA